MDERPSGTMRGARPFVGSWLPAIAWAGLIFAFSAQPSLTFVPGEGLDVLIRKAEHIGVFGILVLLLWRAVATTSARRRPWAWALALTVLYAITDEVHQAGAAGGTRPWWTSASTRPERRSPWRPPGSSGCDGPDGAK